MDNLWVLPAGTPRSASRLFVESDAMRECIHDLRSHFDYILIDSPPVSMGGALICGEVTDGVVLVVRANATNRRLAKDARAQLESARAEVLGAVLNDYEDRVSGGIYGRLWL